MKSETWRLRHSVIGQATGGDRQRISILLSPSLPWDEHRTLHPATSQEELETDFFVQVTQLALRLTLVLDGPTYALDFAGVSALRLVLQAWPGGLVVVSHDREILDHLGVGRRFVLDGEGGHRIEG